jgi:hypothetical protein
MIVFACMRCLLRWMPHPSPCSAIYTDAKAAKATTASMASWANIYADGTGFLLCVNAKDERYQSLRRWTNIKRRLAFCRITQDGDEEGCLHLDQLPTPADAVLIREALGIRKRRTLTEDGRAQLAVARRAANSTFNATAIDLIEQAATPHAAPADAARLVHTQQGSAT